MLLESLQDQIEFESLKSSIYYGADLSIYTAARVQFLLRPPDKRSYGAGAVKKKRKVGFAMKLTTVVWIEVMNTRIVLVNQKSIHMCYICGSEKYPKARCLQKTQKSDRATTSDHKQKLRGNCKNLAERSRRS